MAFLLNVLAVLLFFGAETYAARAQAQSPPPEITRALSRRLPASIAMFGDPTPVDPRKADEREKVVGGRDAQAGQFKWQVALILASAPKQDPFKGHFCGGSLIAWRWVLTAAHCVFTEDPTSSDAPRQLEPRELDIYAGSHNFTGGQRIQVKRILPHEDYGHVSHDNDIALIELADQPSGRDSLDVMPLADVEQMINTKLTVVGWGSTQRGSIPMEQRRAVQTLQYLDDVLPREIHLCNQHLVRSMRLHTARILQRQGVVSAEVRKLVDKWFPVDKELVTQNMFCAGGSGGGDSCFGDSGGPLVIAARQKPRQVGIVSWGPAEGCGLTSLYGVYTRLSNYRDWVTRTTGGAVSSSP